MDSIGKIFDFLSETNLVEEDFYNHEGKYPVYSGQTEGQGLIACIDSYNQDEPCITFATYGSAGKMYYRNGKYTIGRNCMGLRPKNEYKDKINLKWFAYKYQNLFYRLRIGPSEGQRSLNRTLLENVQITIPDGEVQEKQLGAYRGTQSLVDQVGLLLQEAESSMKPNMEITEYIYEPTIENLFHIIGGNSGLTEEFIYHNLPNSPEASVPILSGATVKANLMGYVARDSRPNNKDLKAFSGPSVLVVRKGIAGQMTFVDKKQFATNDDAYVLVIQEEWKTKINLRWFAYQYQELFYNLVTARSANATFNKEYAKRQKVKIPQIDFQNKIGEKLLRIDQAIEQLESIEKQLENLAEYEIV